MKKTLIALCSAAILLLFCACGKSNNPDTQEDINKPETPAQETQAPDKPEQQEVPASGSDVIITTVPASSSDLKLDELEIMSMPNVTLIPLGESFSTDLNGDGTEEKICVSLVDEDDGWFSVKLTINDIDHTGSVYVDGVVLDCPDPYYWAVTDIYRVDTLKEIAIQDWGPSDDYSTNFFRYDGNEIYPIGGVEGMIFNGTTFPSDLRFDEDGFISTYMRFDVLQTWFGKVRYEIGNREWLTIVPEDTYFATRPANVTAMVALAAYDMDGNRFTLSAGDDFTILGTDNMEWLYCKNDAEDSFFWLHLSPDSGFEIETMTDYSYVWDALDGLLFAD